MVHFNITGVVILKVILLTTYLRGELKHHYIVDILDNFHDVYFSYL